MSALTLGLTSSGVTEVEAECTFVLVSETPEVNLKSWYKHLSTSKYHSFQSSAKRQEGEELTFPLGSCLGPAYCTEPLFYVCVSTEKQSFLQGCSSIAGFCSLLNLLIRGKTFTLIILISVVRRNILMSVKTSVSSLNQHPLAVCCSWVPLPFPKKLLPSSRSLVRVMLQTLCLVACLQ